MRQKPPIFALIFAGTLSLASGDQTRAEGLPIDPDSPVAGATSAAKPDPPNRAAAKPKGRRSKPRRAADEPPPCPSAVRAAPQPPARSMPELFSRMGESFARNPATGFNAFMTELSQMEGPALEGVRVTIDEERRAGKQAREDYLAKARARGFGVVTDKVRLDYVRALVDRFASRMKHRDRYPKIDVTLIDAPISDGQSIPGGSVVFTTALLDEPDEATVAGVVAHELAHLDRGHLYEYVRRTKLMQTGFAPPDAPGATFDQLFTRQAALMGMMFNPFRPQQEDEADCVAVTWMYQEGYDPRALVGFFERMYERKNDQPDNPFFSFGRTHPFSLDRRNHVLARLAQLQRWRPRRDLGLFAENLKAFEPRPKPDEKK